MNLNATIIAQMIILLIVVRVAMWMWPQLTEAIQKRQQKIADGLAAAERGQKDLEAAESRVEEIVKEARTRAQSIEHNAQRQANDIVEAARRSATAEGFRLLEAAKAQIALDTQKARDELRGQVGALAVAGASKLIGKEIDARTHADLLDRLVAQI